MSRLVLERKKSSHGKKNRKFNRKKRKPCQQRYTSERRWEKNKMRRAQKYANKFSCNVVIKIHGELVTISHE